MVGNGDLGVKSGWEW